MNTSIGARQLDFNITVTDGGFFSAHPTVDWSMRTHPSPMSKFYYITEGRCRITIDGREYSAKAGDWFFIPARVEHSYNNYVGEPFKKYWMHFELYPHKNLVSLLGLDYKINPKEKKECDALFKKFATLYKKSGVADLISVKSVALELLSIFIRSSQKREEEISEDSDSLFPGVFLYIENNMSRQILL